MNAVNAFGLISIRSESLELSMPAAEEINFNFKQLKLYKLI